MLSDNMFVTPRTPIPPGTNIITPEITAGIDGLPVNLEYKLPNKTTANDASTEAASAGKYRPAKYDTKNARILEASMTGHCL